MKTFGLLVSLMAASAIATASDYEYEFTPVIGGVWTEGNLQLKNEMLYGGEFQFNKLGYAVKPELSIFYTPDAEYEMDTRETDIYRFALNGVYEYEKTRDFLPFVKAGVGYETIDKGLYGNRDSVFGDLGAGVKIPLAEQIALKLEAIYMLKYNDDRWDNNLAGVVGIAFAFGRSEPKVAEREPEPPKAPEPVAPLDSDADGVVDASDNCPDTPRGVGVDRYGCALDSDNDGVADYKDSCAATPYGVKVSADGCAIDSDGDGVVDANDRCPDTPSGAAVDADGCLLDSDADGVADHYDSCPATPNGFKVDSQGCPVKLSLALTYETGSDRIDAASAPKVEAFARFLNDSPAYSVHITGHTDNVGSQKNNQILSEKRAISVRNMLVEHGVDAGRITTEGKGESEPVADNATKEGREANRRIEADLRH